jgi:hypothetical protein
VFNLDSIAEDEPVGGKGRLILVFLILLFLSVEEVSEGAADCLNLDLMAPVILDAKALKEAIELAFDFSVGGLAMGEVFSFVSLKEDLLLLNLNI